MSEPIPLRGDAIPAPAEHDFSLWPDGRINGYFEISPPAMQWFCDQRLLAGRGHLLVGIGGSSKTRALYHLGIGAVLGRLPWDWTVSATGSAALFLTEDVAAQVHRVMHSMGSLLDVDERRRLAAQLRVYPLAGRHARLLELNGQRLHESAAYGWLMEQLDKMPRPLAFVGIDPALGITEGDELSQSHQRRVGELIDHIGIESGACTVLSAHAAKGTTQADEPGSHSSRGGGAITDAVRAEFVLRNMTANEALGFGIAGRGERQFYVQLAATKGNELPPQAYEPVWLKRTATGSLEQVILEPAKAGTVGDRERRALDVLVKTAPTGDTSMKFWREQCQAEGVIPKEAQLRTAERSMERIRDALRQAGLVEPGVGKGLWKPTPFIPQ